MHCREELNEYWTKVIAIDKVTEFNKHHCSAALKAFIDVDGALLGDKVRLKLDTCSLVVEMIII